MHAVIGIDVSKATSQVAVAVDGKVVQNFKITHDVFGFNQLNTVIMQFNTFPDIVFEATSVYSRRLKTFLEAHNYPYTYLNPLTTKKQLDQLRPNKNDLNDAKHLAETQFILKRAKSYVQNPIYIELQDMSRFYQQLNHDIVSAKNRLHRLLQLTFPEIETLFSTTDSQQYWEIVSLIPHATMAKHSRQTLSDTIQSSVSRQIGIARLTRLVDKLVALGSLSAPAVAVASYNVTEVRYYAQRLIALSQSKANVLATVVDQTKNLPEYDIYQSIPGFSDKTVVSLIAELGDYKSSGFITKRGNTIARKVLFKAISNIASTATYGHQNHINDWYQKKKQSSMSKGTKKIAIGAMSRLLRTMHYLVLNNQLYDYDTASKR
ncbi:IS110 family transposase [Leuconostoc lactis]